MGKSTDDLKSAFAGESQANRKYLAYGAKAERDGFPNVAKLFRAAADAETVHATNHWRTLGMIRSTLENLQDAHSGENYEVEEMYPAFMADADGESDNKAKTSFANAFEAERVHRALYADALAVVQEGKDIPAANYFTCSVCGFTHVGDAPPEKCPVCGSLAKAFRAVE